MCMISFTPIFIVSNDFFSVFNIESAKDRFLYLYATEQNFINISTDMNEIMCKERLH